MDWHRGHVRPPTLPRGGALPFVLAARPPRPTQGARLFSSWNGRLCEDGDQPRRSGERLTHVSPSGTAHMVSISSKPSTSRIAVAVCSVHFSNPAVVSLIRDNEMKKGDVLGVARIAGIMAAKRAPDLIPLCHPVALSHAAVELELVEADPAASRGARIEVRATAECDGKTGVEMEALTAASTAALTVYDMCKAVDKGMRIQGLRVVLKDGGKSGRWVEGAKEEDVATRGEGDGQRSE